MWPGGTQSHGGELFGPPSTMPPGNGQHQQQNPGAPFQNRMYGDSVGGGYGGAARAPQCKPYTPQPLGGFNTGQPVGYTQMEGSPGYPPGQTFHTHPIRWARHTRARFTGYRVSSSTGHRPPTVQGKSSNAKQSARQGQALSRMMVVRSFCATATSEGLDGADLIRRC